MKCSKRRCILNLGRATSCTGEKKPITSGTIFQLEGTLLATANRRNHHGTTVEAIIVHALQWAHTWAALPQLLEQEAALTPARIEAGTFIYMSQGLHLSGEAINVCLEYSLCVELPQLRPDHGLAVNIQSKHAGVVHYWHEQQKQAHSQRTSIIVRSSDTMK